MSDGFMEDVLPEGVIRLRGTAHSVALYSYNYIVYHVLYVTLKY